MLRQIDFEKTPVVEAINDILVDARKRGASDIHFDPLADVMKVRIRIDGLLHDYTEVPNSIKKNLITRIKIISGMNITESRLPQDGAIKANIKDVDLDLRVSSIPTIEGEKIVIRILDYSMSNSGLETLGFSEVNLKKVIQMINVPNGIILITGATGSGKSTTVYSILHRLNKEETNIITVEDPIEMNITGINQIQTNSEIGLDFATALRSILRQDPNIIMIGEIRDTETAKIAVRASITGHLVLSTIHTNDSLNTIERLLDMDVERYLLSSALTGIISQKLARKLCPHCRQKRATSDYERNIFKKVLGRDVNEIYSAVGCDECGNGYSGRIAIHEVLMINQDIKDAISSNVRKDELRELVYNSDVITLLQDGLEKVESGLTTFEEILKLIELEEDEKLANASSLEKAIKYSNIANNSEIHSSVSQNTVQSTQQINSEQTNVSNTDATSSVANNSNDIQNNVQISNQSAPINVTNNDNIPLDNSSATNNLNVNAGLNSTSSNDSTDLFNMDSIIPDHNSSISSNNSNSNFINTNADSTNSESEAATSFNNSVDSSNDSDDKTEPVSKGMGLNDLLNRIKK